MVPKILVVDDDPNMRELLALHLTHAGYRVETAEDGIDAGYKVLYQRPDLIICDVLMPHLGGFEFVAALRADSVLRDIPVIFLTTAAEGDQKGKELGALAYVRKPVRADHLLSLIAANIEGGLLPIR
jgi:CheY-like chemotaxis protein